MADDKKNNATRYVDVVGEAREWLEYPKPMDEGVPLVRDLLRVISTERSQLEVATGFVKEIESLLGVETDGRAVIDAIVALQSDLNEARVALSRVPSTASGTTDVG